MLAVSAVFLDLLGPATVDEVCWRLSITKEDARAVLEYTGLIVGDIDDPETWLALAPSPMLVDEIDAGVATLLKFKVASDSQPTGKITASRLGRVERFLICYALRQRDALDDFHSRSGALQAYWKERNHLTTRHRRNVRATIPIQKYRSLQATFSRALRQLAQKGHIEIYRGVASQLLDFGQGWIPRSPEHEVTIREGVFYVNGELVSIYNVENWQRYRVAYRLTSAGGKIARAQYVGEFPSRAGLLVDSG